MKPLADKTRALLKAAENGHPDSVMVERPLAEHNGGGGDTQPSTASNNVFCREGEYWTIDYNGAAIRMRDTKGLQHIAHLLAHAGREFHIADLVGLAVMPENKFAYRADRTVEGDLGPVLDSRATAELKRRVRELRAEVDDADEAGDLGRADVARQELELIGEALSASYGLGGRARRVGDPAERLRKAVTNQIRRALEKIRSAHPELGHHLANSIRTGFVCAYRPERPVDWRF